MQNKVGLFNLGNTCYQSSLVQALNMIPDIADHCLVREEGSRHGNRVVSELAQLLNSMHQGEPRHIVNPSW